MARNGMIVDRTIVVDRLGADEVAQRLVRALGREGVYRSAMVGPGSYQFLRTFRPTWAVVTAWVTTVLLLGGGLLFFLVKRTESCTVTVAGGRRGATVNVSGRILPAFLVELEAVLTEPIDLTAFDGAEQSPVEPSPVDASRAEASPESLVLASAAPAPVSWPNAAPPSPPVPLARRDPSPGLNEDAPTIAVPRVPRQEARRAADRRWVLAFDSGLRAPVDGAVLVGRDPVPMVPADRGARLLRIEDPSMSVSRTHLALGLGAEGPWVEDRGSTNGTAVVDRAGSASPLTPGVKHVLASGAVVVFGERRVELQEA